MPVKYISLAGLQTPSVILGMGRGTTEERGASGRVEKREGYDAQHCSFIGLIKKQGDEVHLLIDDEFSKYWDMGSGKLGKIRAKLAKEAPKK
jgi:hypothetical protein